MQRDVRNMTADRLPTRSELEREVEQLGAALRAAMDHITDLTADKARLEKRLARIREAVSNGRSRA